MGDELSVEQVGEYVPMTYRFFEAVKEGEYEHNLRILAAFMAKELKQDIPDAPNFARTARRLEGITRRELALIALVDPRMAEFRKPEAANQHPFGFVCTENLATHAQKFSRMQIAQ
jgi:hypothetical protein